jgi:tetratricopeptide (TPR) repeat protein
MNAMAEHSGSLSQALAHAQWLMNQHPVDARQQLLEILQVLPQQPEALRLLALLDVREGRSGDALAGLREAVRIDPYLPQAWRQLADQLLAAGDVASAATAYLHHVQHSQRDPVLLRAGNALAQNHLPEAEQALRDHLKRAPTDVAAMRMLAELAERLGRHEDAEALLQRCLELAPDFHAARHNYALVLHRGNRAPEALQQIERLLEREPDHPGHLNLKAAILCRMGEYPPAIEIYDRVLSTHPKQSQVWMSYGHALKTSGEQARAIEAYRRSLALEPGFGEAWWSLANLKTVRFDAADIAQMQVSLQRADLPVEHRFHLHFALGKALEDAADYASSFAHYAQANALRRGQLLYSADDTSARTQRIKQTYSPEFFANRDGQGCAASDPIFVVGLPRSGSTLIEQILSSHSQVEGTMELPEIISLTRLLRRQSGNEQQTPYHDVLAALDADALHALGEHYLQRTRVQRKTDAPFFIDKMPNNFVHIGLIQLILPNARIIDARRHPMACGFSGFKQHFARGQNFSYSLDDIGRYYRDYVELMAHFDAVLPGRVHRVIYEDMIDNTESEVRRLLAYCGLPFEAGCLRFFENSRPVRTASSEQVRKPIYREGIDHWRHYEPWLQALKTALGSVLTSYPKSPSF